MKFRRWQPEHSLVVLATLLAAVLRFSSLSQLPPQAWIDEVWVSSRAYQIIQTGELTAHYGLKARGGGGDAGLAFLAVLPELLGFQSIIASRVVTAVAGIVAVPVAYACLKELLATEGFKYRRRLALIAAVTLSYLPYQVILSRVGMEAGSMPVMYLWCVWQLQRGLQRGAWSGWVLAGLVGGAMQYAGPHARFVLPLMAFMIVQAFIAARAVQRWAIMQGAALFSVIGTGVCVWLIMTFIQHPNYLLGRAATVTQGILHGGTLPPVVAVALNVLRMLASFNLVGDSAVRHNVPGSPMLDPLMSLGFVAGIIWSMANVRRSALARLLMAWLILLMIPSVVTVGAPNFERTSGIVGAPIGLMACGWGVIANRVQGWAKWAEYRWRAVALAGLLLAASLIWNITSVFVRWPQTPTIAEEFTTGAADALHTLVRRSATQPVFVDIIRGATDLVPMRIVLQNTPVKRVSLQDCLPLADDAPTLTTYVVNSYQDITSTGLLTDIYPGSRIVLDRFSLWEEGNITQIEVPAGARVTPPRYQPLAEFVPGVGLYGYDWSGSDMRPGGSLSLAVYWKVLRPIQSDLTPFFHVQPAGSGEVPPLAQYDERPCADTYPTTDWQPGVIVKDWFTIPLPADLAPGKYELLTGWYDTTTQARIPLQAADQSTIGGRAIIGVFEIQPR